MSERIVFHAEAFLNSENQKRKREKEKKRKREKAKKREREREREKKRKQSPVTSDPPPLSSVSVLLFQLKHTQLSPAFPWLPSFLPSLLPFQDSSHPQGTSGPLRAPPSPSGRANEHPPSSPAANVSYQRRVNNNE